MKRNVLVGAVACGAVFLGSSWGLSHALTSGNDSSANETSSTVGASVMEQAETIKSRAAAVSAQKPTVYSGPRGATTTRNLAKDLAAALLQDLDEQDRPRIPGYASLEVDAPSRVVLWWKNDLPITQQRILSDLPPGVTVELHAAPYSLAEKKVAMAKLLGPRGEQNAVATRFHARIDAMAPDVDHIEVFYEDTGSPTVTPEDLAKKKANLENALTVEVGLPVVVEKSDLVSADIPAGY